MNRRRWAALAAALLGANALVWLAVLAPRPPVVDWSVFEQRRPRVLLDAAETGVDLAGSSDGPEMALARRAVGGWETASFRLGELANLLPYLAARATFQSLQARPGGTSRLHADLATAVFVLAGAGQWVAVAALFSRKGRARRGIRR